MSDRGGEGAGGDGREAGAALPLSALGDVRILGTLGKGTFATVYAGRYRDEDVVLKLFHHRIVERHARRHRVPLAEYEYRRNLAFRRAPGLAPHVARPIGYVSAGGVAAVVQERLRGEIYADYDRRWRTQHDIGPPGLFGALRHVVGLAHEAGLFDLDLHPGNVMVVEHDGRAVPKLFDFSRIPAHEHPRNPLEALLFKLGLLGPRSRDLRKLREFPGRGEDEGGEDEGGAGQAPRISPGRGPLS